MKISSMMLQKRVYVHAYDANVHPSYVPLTKLRLWIRTHQMAKVSFRALEPEISRDLRQPPCPMLKFMILIFDFVLYWMIHCFIFRVCQVCMRDFDL